MKVNIGNVGCHGVCIQKVFLCLLRCNSWFRWFESSDSCNRLILKFNSLLALLVWSLRVEKISKMDRSRIEKSAKNGRNLPFSLVFSFGSFLTDRHDKGGRILNLNLPRWGKLRVCYANVAAARLACARLRRVSCPYQTESTKPIDLVLSVWHTLTK